MSTNLDSSIDTGFSTTQSGADGSFEQTVYTDSITVAVGEGGGSGDGLGAVLGVDATAVGTDTLAEVAIDAEVTDNGASSSLSLSADASAAAADLTDPYGAVAIWYEVLGPVGSYVEITEVTTLGQTTDAGSVVVATSSVDFDAVALQDPFAGDPVSATWEQPPEPEYVLDPMACDCGPDPGATTVALDGNLALYDIELDATGSDSFTSLSVDALAFDDRLSTVTAVVEVAVA